MKYLWFLLPFTLFWAFFYIASLMETIGWQWWTVPALVTMALAVMASFAKALIEMPITPCKDDQIE